MNDTANAVMGTLSGRRTIIIKAACGHKVYGEANDMFAAEKPKVDEVKDQARKLPCSQCVDIPGWDLRPSVSDSDSPPATPKQVKYAQVLIRKHRGEYTAHGQVVGENLLVGISKADCSRLIDDLLAGDN